MRYVRSCWEKSQRDLAYQMYVTDCLQCITENTTHIGGLNGIADYGKTMQTRWYDIINPPEPIIEDVRPCEDIVAGIFDRIRGGASGGN